MKNIYKYIHDIYIHIYIYIPGVQHVSMIQFDEMWYIKMSSVCLGNHCGRLPRWQWRRTAFGPKLQLDECDMENQPETFLYVTHVTFWHFPIGFPCFF